MKKTFLVLFFLNCFFCFSQDWKWWNDKHNWDGITPWTRYLILSPKYMGPNALPVPETKNGLLPDDIKFELSAEKHFGKGDITENLYTSLFIPIAKKKAGLSINIVPYEHYEMDTITRDIRKARDFDGKGTSGGDFYFGTNIQILNETERLPDIMLSLNMKTASGTNYSGARFTDSPGYFFDISFGKSYTYIEAFIEHLRLYAMLGFYAWQTNRDDFRQNDAILYGFGVSAHIQKIIIDYTISGYKGYINNGDKPKVYRLMIKTNLNSRINYKAMFQYGKVDFPYNTIRVGTEIKI